MKVTFVYGGFENLGVEYLSSCLKNAGHQTALVYSPKLFSDTMLDSDFLAKIFARRKEMLSEIIATKPGLIAFSVVTDDFVWALDLASGLKKKAPEIPIIFGGIHPTSVPETVMQHKQVDFVCVGEGEEAIVELADTLEKGLDPSEILNIWGRKNNSVYSNPVRPLIENLDLIPFPDKDIFYNTAPYHSYSYTTMTSRGCSLNCPYCHHNVTRKVYSGKGKYFRRRSVENVISELKLARLRYNFRRVIIEDDMILEDKPWVMEFCRRYQEEIGLPFMTIGHPTQVDEEMAQALADAGCKYLEIGVQTFNQQVKKDVLHRPEKNGEVIAHLQILNRFGIRFNVDQLAGLPGDREEDLMYAAEIYNELRPNRIYFLFLTYYPRTEMCDIVTKMGYASEKEIEKVRHGLGESTIQRGSVTREIFSEFRFLFGFLPLLPKFAVSFLLKNGRYKKLPRWIPLCTNLPNTIGDLFCPWITDFRGPIIIRKYVYHFFRLGK